MQHGTVKWFNNAKGFGFICPDDGSGDVFAHYSVIQVEENTYRTLRAGQNVVFELHSGPKGQHAANVIPK